MAKKDKVECKDCGGKYSNIDAHIAKKHSEKKEDAVVKNDDVSLDAKMDQVVAGLNTVAGALSKLVELQTADKSPSSKESEPAKATFTPKIEDETMNKAYIPAKYRALVDEILSPEFGISLHDFDDRTDFWFEVIVPEKFSSISAEDRQKGVRDLRGKMISRALGENGIRDWCNLIRKNLSRYYSAEGVRSPFTNAA